MPPEFRGSLRVTLPPRFSSVARMSQSFAQHYERSFVASHFELTDRKPIDPTIST